MGGSQDYEEASDSESDEGSDSGSDEDHHGHAHAHSRPVISRGMTIEAQSKLKRAVWFSVFFMVLEIVCGIISNSLSILTDAAHMLSDVAGFYVSIISLSIVRKAATENYTYGYRQAEVVGALISISVVWAVTVILFIEAVNRFIEPEPIHAPVMFFTAVVGLIVNIILMNILGHGHSHDGDGDHGHSHGGGDHGHAHGGGGSRKNLALNAAVVHVMGDILQSVGVIVAAALIWWGPSVADIGSVQVQVQNVTKIVNGTVTFELVGTSVSRWLYADPFCTVLFGILVMCTTKGTAMATLRSMMVKAPGKVNTRSLRESLARGKHVKAVHDFHVWGLGTRDVICTAHLVVDSHENVSEALQAAVTAAEAAGVTQPTFQTEIEGRGGWLCDGPRAALMDDHGHGHGHEHGDGGHGEHCGHGDHGHGGHGGHGDHGHGGHGGHGDHGHSDHGGHADHGHSHGGHSCDGDHGEHGGHGHAH